MLRATATFLAIALAASAAEKRGFVSLFDGKTLNGWTLFNKNPKDRGYIVEDGAITCPLDGGGNLLTEKDYANFVLRFEFKMEAGGNNGIGIRAPLAGDIAYTGMEIQVLDHDHEKYKGKIKPAQFHGSVYDVIAAKPGVFKPIGQWNREEIVANGSKIRVTLNGKVILDADLSTVTDPKVLEKHPGIKRTTGRIGFLGHHSLVSFRKIQIKELP